MHQLTARRRRSSCERAVNLAILGRIKIPTRAVPAINANPLSSVPKISNDVFGTPDCKPEIIIKIIMAIMSCTIRNPIEILPYNESMSPLSVRSFITIIVLLNVIAIEIYADMITLKPKSFNIRNPITNVKIICPSPVIRETFPKSLIALGFKLSPTVKSRSAIPNSASIPKFCSDLITFKR